MSVIIAKNPNKKQVDTSVSGNEPVVIVSQRSNECDNDSKVEKVGIQDIGNLVTDLAKSHTEGRKTVIKI